MAKRKRHGNAGRRKTQATGAARRGATPADAAVVATNQDNSIMDQNEDEEDESRGMLHEEDGENSVMLDNGCTNNSESLIIEQPDDYTLNSGMSMEASSSSIRLDESMAAMEQDNSNSTMSNNTGPTFQCSACKEVYSTQRAAQSHIIKAHYGLVSISPVLTLLLIFHLFNPIHLAILLFLKFRQGSMIILEENSRNKKCGLPTIGLSRCSNNYAVKNVELHIPRDLGT